MRDKWHKNEGRPRPPPGSGSRRCPPVYLQTPRWQRFEQHSPSTSRCRPAAGRSIEQAGSPSQSTSAQSVKLSQSLSRRRRSSVSLAGGGAAVLRRSCSCSRRRRSCRRRRRPARRNRSRSCSRPRRPRRCRHRSRSRHRRLGGALCYRCWCSAGRRSTRRRRSSSGREAYRWRRRCSRRRKLRQSSPSAVSQTPLPQTAPRAREAVAGTVVAVLAGVAGAVVVADAGDALVARLVAVLAGARIAARGSTCRRNRSRRRCRTGRHRSRRCSRSRWAPACPRRSLRCRRSRASRCRRVEAASAAGPRDRELAVPVGVVVAAGGVAAVQLADDPVVLVEQRRAGGAALGGAHVPVDHPLVGPVAGNRRAEVAGRRRGLVLEADPLLVDAGVVDRHGGRGVGAAAVPAGEGDAPGRIRVLVQLDQGEVGRTVLGAEERAALPVGQRAVGRAAAGRGLVVPVDHQRGGVVRADAAVVGGHEVGRLVLAGVVDHEAGAEQAAAGGDHADRGDLVPPAVTLGTDHVDVAGTGLVRLDPWSKPR